MFELADAWVWDTWFTRADGLHHAFHLQAPRSLGDPALRHHAASIGHATSTDLRHWRPGGTAVRASSTGFDDLATWTGCVVRDDDGGWHLITSGLSRAEGGRVQRIGGRTAARLEGPWGEPRWVLEADPRWYAVLGDAAGADETHWRDPWVVRGDDGRWHLHATARAAGTAAAVIAHATSDDLLTWQVQPPLSAPSRRFGWAEVVSFHRIGGRWWLLFSCLGDQLRGADAAIEDAGGTWIVACEGPGRPVDLDAAVRLTTARLYVARLVPADAAAAPDAERTDLPLEQLRLVAFVDRDADGHFGGRLTDPLRLAWAEHDAPALVDGDPAWHPHERPARAGLPVTATGPSIHDGSSGTYLPVEEN